MTSESRAFARIAAGVSSFAQSCHLASEEEEEERKGDQLARGAASGEPPTWAACLPDIVGHPGEQLVLHPFLPEAFSSIWSLT